MTYQAYLDSVREQTGLSPDDFRDRAAEKGLLRPGVKAGEVVSWLKAEYGLGHGHAMAVYGTIRAATAPVLSAQDLIDKHFTGKRSVWRPSYEELIAHAKKFGDDFTVQAGNSYISLLRNKKKFAIVKVSAERLDLGIKLKGTQSTARLLTAGKWNSMVTHRVSLKNAEELDRELMSWLHDAYTKA
jgi:Domain of unknown function (DUF4287)/Domain of unknown function (DUF5655)